MNSDAANREAGDPRAFTSTRWSLVLSAAKSQSGEEKARNALDELCRIYWRPVFSFICRRGFSTEDAQDLTQEFFVKILERDWLEHADRNRGRFRSLLLTSLQTWDGVRTTFAEHVGILGGMDEVAFLAFQPNTSNITAGRTHRHHHH
jgi:hypothetical protein